jgi:hypothetical protein
MPMDDIKLFASFSIHSHGHAEARTRSKKRERPSRLPKLISRKTFATRLPRKIFYDKRNTHPLDSRPQLRVAAASQALLGAPGRRAVPVRSRGAPRRPLQFPAENRAPTCTDDPLPCIKSHVLFHVFASSRGPSFSLTSFRSASSR